MRRPYRRSGLSERDIAVIEIERRWGPGPSAVSMKLDDAADHLGMDARTYTLIVNSLIDDPRAHEIDPKTMGQLRAIRDQHRDARAAATAVEPEAFRVEP
ncbi:DUF3263 domain-containing protein [Mobilicoccus caccae]|uniref:DUF3263 domain-containing protein n=1 Tax=Mobilicoccus caccae TaxID=1859295 RepID=A0ABQ6INS2_9MICO|nr:DUF3263 domain-containing protein [Mobilicoccus caccae]GMA39550.1 hypothetical protein GCM10025883_15950 [Mobilicoccus caccae]